MGRVEIKARKRNPTIPRTVVMNPGKGLNTLLSDNMIDDRELSDMANIVFIEGGAATKRNGFTTVGAALSATPKGIGSFVSGSDKYIVVVDGIGLKYLKNTLSGSWSAAGSTGTNSAAFTSAAEVTYTQARGNLYVWNGTEGGAYFNGTNAIRPGTMPRCKFSIFYQGYHFAAGVPTQPNRLYISNSSNVDDMTDTADDATSHPGATVFAGTSDANYVDIDKDDGDKITGLAKFQEILVAFKEKAIYAITLDSSGVPTVAALNRSIGAVSHKSIDNVENDVFFLSRKGYYVLGNEPNFFNAIRSNELSSRIKPLVDTIAKNYYDKVASIFHQFTFYTAIPEGGTTTNNTVLGYDRRFLGWRKHDTIHANSFTVHIDSNNTERLLFAADDAAQIYEIDSNYSDNGSAIDSYLVTKAFDLGNFDIEKFWVDVTLLFRQLSGEAEITVYLDNDQIAKQTTISPSETTGELGTQVLGLEQLGGDPDTMDIIDESINTTTNVPYRIPINRGSRTIKIKVANANLNERFVLLGISLAYYPYSHYKFPSDRKLY